MPSASERTLPQLRHGSTHFVERPSVERHREPAPEAGTAPPRLKPSSWWQRCPPRPQNGGPPGNNRTAPQTTRLLVNTASKFVA